MSNLKIGLPRAMLYHRYSMLWTVFFQQLGAEVVTSRPTDKEILDQGTALCVDEACLSEKIYLGHVKSLIGTCDYILVPRISNFGHKHMMCVRFEAMPDIVKNVFRDVSQKFLTYNLDVLQKQDEKSAFYGQIVAVLCISVDLHGLNNAEMQAVIISADNTSGLKDSEILRIGGNIHLKAATLVVFNVPQERGKAIAHCFQCDRQIAFICFHVIHFNLHITPPDKRLCGR